MLITRCAILPFVLAALLVAGCDGGDSPTAPDPGPQPVPVPGSLVLPAGFPAGAGTLTVVCGMDSVRVGADGAFTLLTGDGSPQVAVASGPQGPLFAGWVSEPAATIDVRSTAKVLLYFTLGAWLLPADGQTQVRDLIDDLGSELDGISGAIAAATIAHPAGLTTPTPTIGSALDAAASAVLAAGRDRGGDKGVVFEPGQEQSGVALLNQGGINTVTFKNSYRRRVQVFVERTSWVDQNDMRYEIDEPPVAFEIAPVSGFAGVLGTIGGWLGGDIAYTPIVSEPIPLEVWPGSKFTEYWIKIGGAGLQGGDEGWLTPAENDAIGSVELKTVVLDYFLPLVVNIVGTVNQLGGLDDLLGGLEGSGNDVMSFVAYCKDSVPAMWGHVQEGDYVAGVFDLYNAAANTPEFRRTLFRFLGAVFVASGMDGVHAAAALDRAVTYLDLVGWFDIVGNYLDSVIVSSHLALAHHADDWNLRVTRPQVHLSSSQAEVFQYDQIDSLWVRVADEVEDPQGWAFAYHWRCDGVAGTLIDPAHPDAPVNEFTTSQCKVSYIADRGTAGTETVIVEVAITQGGELRPVGADTLTFAVSPRTVTLTPVTTNVAADCVRWFEAKCVPPLPEDAEVVYAWSGGGNAGTLKSADGTAAPCETADASATYHAHLAAGSDQVHVTVTRILAGGVRRNLGSATATANVRPDMIEGRLVWFLWLYPEQFMYRAPVFVEFDKRPGTTHYLVHGYNYNDFTGYYGTDYLHSGPPFDSHDEQTETVYRIFLTGMSGSLDPNHPPTEDEVLGWNRARFAGSIWEVWPQD